MKTLSGIPIASYETEALTVHFYHMKTKREIYALVYHDEKDVRQATLTLYTDKDGTHYVRTCGHRIKLESCEVPDIRLKDGFTWERFLS